MAISTFSSREFNQDVSKIKKASSHGPVFITDRGHPAHVLLTIEDYLKLSKTKETIVDLLAMPDTTDLDFEAPKLKGNIYRTEEFD
ncbi:type II toxin-antitoxin system Phd/YefM family antitoxin [Legionella sp. 16cNR16C]|uniref:type II toxin-antitoxin system Phd/YefM family antitoxin n=1 Tax=Legionella sp. 16cNR16C TaxID=2905656 RepID=UPI001E63259E|nr:type II toxin-antitoxin system Phd/YefM family antitoxin [Legionella sp. 16cNR16C]MCE3045045.1 type II toxin-antitoxin system Phd/YefM family antitoxin [Legionella sp. 16cNR16C]